MRNVRIFVSSPEDVAEERFLAHGVIERLQGEFAGHARLHPLFWEQEPLLATNDYQSQLPSPADSDVFVSILWSRLGSPLPQTFTREDGSRYQSGTEYEFETARSSFLQSGKPDLLVYRKTSVLTVALDDERQLLAQLEQKKALDRFLDRWFVNPDATAKGAYHRFSEPGDFEALFESHLRKLIVQRLPEGAAGQGSTLWTQGSPFRGLAPFEPEHSRVFFGRTRAISEVIDALREQANRGLAFVLILGMSGGGKSSLVRAGVLPLLIRPGIIKEVSRWHHAIFRPADGRGALFGGLARALQRDAPELFSGEDTQLASRLEDDPQQALGTLNAADSQERLLLFVDQVEELFTAPDITRDTISAFLRLLDRLARSGKVWVVATLRSDFYPHCHRFPTLMALKAGRGQYDLQPPNPNEIGQIIRLPARSAGLGFEEDSETGERLDDVLRDAASNHPEVLPLLEFTLDELYQRRSAEGLLTHAAYTEIGGVEGSIAQRAEHVFEGLSPKVQEALPHVLNVLVTKGPAQTAGATRARVGLDGIPATGRELVEAFVDARLFVTDLDADKQVIVTIAHEALIMHWPRIQAWIRENEENLRLHGRIAAAAELWVSERRRDLLLPAGRPVEEAELLLQRGVDLTPREQEFVAESQTRLRRNRFAKSGLAATLVVLTLAAGTGAYLANQQSNLARTEAETAGATTQFLIDLFQVSDPWSFSPITARDGSEITAREVLDIGAARIAEELADEPVVQASLMTAIGRVYQGLGLLDQARPMLLEALAIRTHVLPPGHPQIGEGLFAIGLVHYTSGEFAEAEAVLREAAEIQREAWGDDSIELARVLDLFSLTLSNLGRYEAALAAQLRALKIHRDNADGDALELALSLNNLGYVQNSLSRRIEATEAFEEAVEILSRTGARGHYSRALANLAALYQVTGRLDESRELHEQALVIKREWFDPEHSEIGFSVANLAWVYRMQGDYARAEVMYRESLQTFIRELGANHPNIGILRSNLAQVLADSGNYAEAESLLKQSLIEIGGTFGSEHIHAVHAHNALGVLYKRTEEWEKAESSFAQALHIAMLANPEHSELAVARAGLAGLPNSALSAQEREEMFTQAVAHLQASEGPDTPRYAQTIMDFALFLSHQRQDQRAEEMYLAGLERLETALSSDHPRYQRQKALFTATFGDGVGHDD